MYSKVLKYLKCPNCGEELKIIWTSKIKKDEIIEGTIGCINDHRWAISEGVLNLSIRKQKNFNAWSEYYKKVDYEELNQQIMSKTPDNLKDLYESTKVYIGSYINKIKPNCILDICSGRGMLISHLTKNLNHNPDIIALDLNSEVLKYTRHKMLNMNSDLKTNYIAIDASAFPVKSSSIDLCTSYFGFFNALYPTEHLLSESKRVLKANGELLHSLIFLNNQTPELDEIHKLLLANNMYNLYDKHISIENLKKLHSVSYKNIDLISIGEEIGKEHTFNSLTKEIHKLNVSLVKCS